MNPMERNRVAWRGQLVLDVISPLHIGTGDVLNAGLEYIVREDGIFRLDMESFLKNTKILRADKESFFTKPLSGDEMKRLRLEMANRYQLKKGSGTTLGEEIRESIKLSGDRAYLPATSLKGAIANAIAWAVFDDVAPRGGNKREHALKAAGNERRAQFKANHLDNCLFQDGRIGEQYNKDLKKKVPVIFGDAKASAMKGLVIRDSGPVGMLEHRCYDIFVCKGGKITPKGRPLALEAIPPGAQITADMYVQKDQLQRVRGYSPSEKAASILCNINDFDKALWNFGKRLAEIEEEFYTDCGMPQIAAFFTGNKNESIFPIGFGTGWNSKTVGPLLNKNERDMARIRFNRGYPPPISRRLALDADGKPVLPIGWAKFKLKHFVE